MIEFKNVTKSFGKVKALEDASFKIGGGEFVFIVGPSGAGKTTILNLLTGSMTPTSGEVIFDKKDISNLKKNQIPLLRRKIGVVFQDFKLLPERTVRENIEVALAVNGVDQDEWQKRVDQVLKLVGLRDRAGFFPAQLSGGEVQRTSLARALVVNPKVIFADEPTGNLDWETAEAIVDLLAKINDEGKTVVVATHHRGIIDKLAKRVIKLEKGKVVEDSGKSKGKSKKKGK